LTVIVHLIKLSLGYVVVSMPWSMFKIFRRSCTQCCWEEDRRLLP